MVSFAHNTSLPHQRDVFIHILARDIKMFSMLDLPKAESGMCKGPSDHAPVQLITIVNGNLQLQQTSFPDII